MPPLFDTYKNVSGHSEVIDAEVLEFEKSVAKVVLDDYRKPDPRDRTDVVIQPMVSF